MMPNESEVKKKAKRKRNIHLHFCVDEEENNLIRKRMADAGYYQLGGVFQKDVN